MGRGEKGGDAWQSSSGMGSGFQESHGSLVVASKCLPGCPEADSASGLNMRAGHAGRKPRPKARMARHRRRDGDRRCSYVVARCAPPVSCLTTGATSAPSRSMALITLAWGMGPDRELNQDPCVPEDLVLEEDLLDDLLGTPHEQRAS